MSEQWLRSCSVEIEGGGKKLTVSDLRVRFSVILAIDMEGDTRGEPWYQTLICYARGGAIPPGSTNYTTAPSYAA